MLSSPDSQRDAICHVVRGSGPIVATAIHEGHAVRPEVAALLRLDERRRLHEEDPFTAIWTHVADTRVVVDRSRFEVDLNRPREGAVYLHPDQAWGIDVWRCEPPPEVVARSLAEYDAFYERMHALFTRLCADHGGFVVYDIHSYNHRRNGPDGEPAPPSQNPQINVGTGNLDRERWAPVVDAFITALRASTILGRPIDARENVKFRGGYFSQWVRDHFGDVGCAIAIEVKKVYVDEWSGRPDWRVIGEVGAALGRTVPRVVEALKHEALR